MKIETLAPSTEHYGVRSLSLEEIVGQVRQPLLVRIARFGKVMLIAWGAISLGAAGGIATYYLGGGSGESILLSEQAPAKPAKSKTVPDAQPTRIATADSDDGANLFAPADQPSMLNPSPPIMEARLPRPRPDEPVITGSIGRPAYDPDYAPPIRRRIVDPCTALRNLGAPIRCSSQRRVHVAPEPAPPPPPVVYYPQPYHPPVIGRP